MTSCPPNIHTYPDLFEHSVVETRNVNVLKGEKKKTQRINEFFWRYIFWMAEGLALSSLTIEGLTLTDRLFKPLCFTPFPASLHMRHYAYHLFYWPLGHVLLWEAIHPWYKWPGLLCGWGSWCFFQNLKIILTHRPELWLLPMVSFSSAVFNWREIQRARCTVIMLKMSLTYWNKDLMSKMLKMLVKFFSGCSEVFWF